MKKLIPLLFGLDSELYNKLSEAERKQYSTKLIAIVISVVTSSIIAVEITYKIVGEVSWVMLPAVFVWIFLIAMMDLLVFRGGVHSIYRLIFSVALISVIVITTFTFISRDDIQQHLEQKSKNEVIQIDSLYNIEKGNRYALLRQKENNQAEYHEKVCIPEAKNVFAGPEYQKKHNNFCVPELLEINKMKAELDSVEIGYHDSYIEKRNNAKALVNPGFFEEFRLVINYIFADAIKITIFLILALLLLCIESIAFFASIKKNETSYKNLEKKSVEANNDINEAILQTEKEQKIAQIEAKARRNSRFEKVLEKMEDYKLLNYIRNNFDKVKKVEPDMFTPNIDLGIEMYLSKESAITQKEIEELFTEISDNFYYATKAPIVKDITNKDINKDYNSCYYNTFYATLPMKQLADIFWSETNGTSLSYCKKIFDWTKQNIAYQKTHDLKHYKTAKEVFATKSGICGEMSIFLNSLLKYKGLAPDYIHVDVDMNGEKVNHACSGIRIKENYYLLDVAYNRFDAKHQRWNKVTDSDLITNMMEWNR